MSINTLQREAFTLSPTFNSQVNGVVVEEAEYRAQFLDPQHPSAPALRQTYANVIRQPAGYGFVPALVAMNTWEIGYDAWALDPDAAKPAIQSAVQVLWTLLTGLEPIE